VEYLKYTFTDLLISSFQIGGTEIIPTEEISFNCTQVQMDYKEQKADGTLSGAISTKYNLKTQSSA
jgi:type VI protein secretion system component Hcp